LIRPRNILRLIHIQWVLVRHGLDEVLFATKVLRPFRFLMILAPWTWFGRRTTPRGVRIRRALEDLGPIFIKFGQMLSTRRDLLPADIADELARLQDRVPPFPGDKARAIISEAWERPVDEVIDHFETTPLASASVAQVHTATLRSGMDVVIKVLRPGIEGMIRRDIALMYFIAHLAQRYWSEGPRLRPVEVVGEYEKTIIDELDLMREAANASQLRRNFEGSTILYIPEVDFPLCHRNVMVMERIRGVPVSHIERLREAGVDMKKLSERGVEIFFTQVFRDNFFHADMHPGNIFVDISTPADPRYLAVDFGIVGTLNPRDQHYLAENFLAFFNRDYRRVAELHVESGWVPPHTRVDEFESAIRTVCEPIFERPLKEISFGKLLLRLFQTARRFEMEVQPQLVLLQKTLLNIEGLGRELYPDLDLWQTAKPFLEDWMRQQVGPRAVFARFRDALPEFGDALHRVPVLADKVLAKLESGELDLAAHSRQLTDMQRDSRRQHRATRAVIGGGSLLVAAGFTLGTLPLWLSIGGAVIGGLLLLFGLYRGEK
jgi:ubiquinone biosynthesis protein